jgi:carboxypeptidase Q
MPRVTRTVQRFAASALAAIAVSAVAAGDNSEWLEGYREPAARLIGESLSTRFAWNRLAELTDRFGSRLSGSAGLDGALRWAFEEMRKDDLEHVRLEPVRVPHWVRGAESLDLTAPRPLPLVMLGLGNSVGTPGDGIEAELIIVRSFTELHASAAAVRGRIVLYNAPFTTYGETVAYRLSGASRAAALGAVAVLVRSIAPPGLRTPHTGTLEYDPGSPRIPAAAIPTEDADRLQRMHDRGERLRVRLRMGATFLPDTDSFNLVAEIAGRERPGEIVVVGGHLDSWDVGTGAVDDGAGCVAAWEALRLMKRLGLRARRTVRVVLWTNEENGLRGAHAYRDAHRAELANHVLMIESDSGVAAPLGFGFSGSDSGRDHVRAIASLLAAVGADRVRSGGGGADIAPSVEAGRIPAMSLDAGGDYFLVHHTAADTVERIDPGDMSRAAAALAVMAYVVADLPDRLR